MTLPEHGQYEQYSYPDEQPAKPEGKELGFWLITFDCDVDVDVGALVSPFICHLLAGVTFATTKRLDFFINKLHPFPLRLAAHTDHLLAGVPEDDLPHDGGLGLFAASCAFSHVSLA